jgi:hypothetical protein
MRFYLKVVNPVIAFLILVLCFWAATFGEDEFNIYGIIIGGLSTYFFAKGLFCASSVLFLGQILLEVIYGKDNSVSHKKSKSQWLYLIALAGFSVSLLIGLFMLKVQNIDNDETKNILKNPTELKLVESYRVERPGPLRIAGKIRNDSDFRWANMTVKANVFIDNKFWEECSQSFPSIEALEETYFALDCREVTDKELIGKYEYKVSIEALRTKQRKKALTTR